GRARQAPAAVVRRQPGACLRATRPRPAAWPAVRRHVPTISSGAIPAAHGTKGSRPGCYHRQGLLRSGFAPSPAKAGEGWGGVSFGSARTVAPSQPLPAFAGGGAKTRARG